MPVDPMIELLAVVEAALSDADEADGQVMDASDIIAAATEMYMQVVECYEVGDKLSEYDYGYTSALTDLLKRIK